MLSRFIKKTAGWFAVFGLAVAVLVLILVFILQTSRFEQAVGFYVNKAIPGKVSYDSMELFPLRGAVEATNVRIDDPVGRPLVKAAHLYVNVSWLSLLGKVVHLDTVIVDKPDVYLETDAEGNLNLIQAFSKHPPLNTRKSEAPFELPVNVTFGRFEMNGGVLRYKDIGAPKEQDEEIIVKGIDIKASKGNINGRKGLLGLDLGPCDIRLEDMNSHVDKLAIETSLHRDVLSPFTLYLDSDMGSCTLKGSISDLWKGPRYNLDVTVDATLAGIDKVFDVECDLKGRVTGNGKVTGHWDDPEIHTVLHCNGGAVLGEVVGDLDLDASLLNRVIDIRRLFVKAPGGRGTITGFVYFDKAFKNGFFTSEFIEPEFAYDLKADQIWAKPGLVPGIPGYMKGTVSSRISFKGKGFFFESMMADALISASAEGFCFFDQQKRDAYRLITTASMDHSKLAFKRFKLEDPTSVLEGKGLYRTDKDTWESELVLRSSDLSRSTFIKPYGDFSGSLDITASMKGTWDKVSGKIRGLGRGLVWDDVVLGEADLDGFLADSGVFSIQRAVLNHPRATLNVKGDIGVFDGENTMDLQGDFTGLDLGFVLDDARMKGVCEGDVVLRGMVEEPVADMKIRAKDLGWGKIVLGDGNGDLHYEKGWIFMNDLSLVNKQSEINIKGSALVIDTRTNSVINDPICDISVTGNRVRIEDFYTSFKGLVSLNVTARGSVSRPYGRVDIEGTNIDLVKQSFRKITGYARLEGENIMIDRLLADVRDGETIEAQGRVSVVNKDYDLSVKAKDISVNHIDILGQQAVIEGKIAVDLTGQGDLDHPELQGKVVVSHVKVKDEAFDDADLDIRMSDGKLTVTGKALAEIDADMDIDTHDFTAKVLFANTALEPFFRMGGVGDFGGVASGTLRAVGNLNSLEHIKAKADITDLLIRNKTLVLLKTDGLDVSYEKERFHIPDSRIVLLDKGYLILGGEGTKYGDVGVYAKGVIPLDIADIFTDQFEGIKGDVLVDGHMGGTIKKPDVKADFEIKSASFMIPELMQNVHDVNGHVKVDTKKVTIDNIKGKLDSGVFLVNGGIDLKNGKPSSVSVDLTGESLPISVPDTLDLTVNTNISFKGTPDDSLVEGNVIILGGKYYKDVSLDLVNVVKGKSREEKTVARKHNEPFLRSMGLNVKITHKNPFEVDNNIAYLPLKPDLTILGTLNNIKLNGRTDVAVDDSFISYQGKVFDVTKGRVDFNDPYTIVPTLDVQCQTEIRDWIIYLLISGTPDNLKFSLTSDPAEEDADILSLLVLGKTTEEVIEGNSDKTQSAAKILAGIVSSNIEKNIKDATGIDKFELEYITTKNSTTTTTETGEEKTTDTIENGVKVTLGKELSERLTLKYGVETKGGVTVHEAVSEYRFLENMLMNAYQDTENKYGAELVYRLEFR